MMDQPWSGTFLLSGGVFVGVKKKKKNKTSHERSQLIVRCPEETPTQTKDTLMVSWGSNEEELLHRGFPQ